MIQDFFINKIIHRKKQENTVYEDWISKKVYVLNDAEIRCRISSLSYKDLQLISDTDNVQRNVMKMYTDVWVDISPKDIVIRDDKEWTVIAQYKPQDKTKIHHRKYFIKMVE